MFDALTARAIAAELTGTIAHGRVQAILPVNALTLGFEIYVSPARRYLLASAEPTHARLQLSTEKLRAGSVTMTPFMLLVRKYANGAFVNRVETVPHERIIRIEFDHAEYGISTLVAELLGQRANLILLDATGQILDAIKRIPPSTHRARTIQPRIVYMPPLPQQKVDPTALTPALLTSSLAWESNEPLWQRLVATVAGTSPLLAREVAFRVTGRTDAPTDPTLASALALEFSGVWRAPSEPTLAYRDGEPVAVAAFALTQFPETESLPSMSAALEKYHGALESYEAVKEPLRAQILAAREKLERKRGSLQRELVSDAEIERLRTSGELILAHATEIQAGQKRLKAEMVEGAPLDIALDPTLSPIENAQKYFAEYRRAKDAGATVPERLQEAGADIAFAQQVLADLDSAETRADIDAVVAEARAAGLVREKKSDGRRAKTTVTTPPRAFLAPGGLQVLVGRNARQNEEVTFERAGPEDLWLHARGASGAHVVLLTHGAAAPESTVEFAASLAAFYSDARTEAWVDVAVTPRKNVRRVSGRAARPGLVNVREELVIRVRPARVREDSVTVRVRGAEDDEDE